MATTSANTEYLICIDCSGTTTTRSTPHPEYGALTSGNTVVQLNAVLVGSRNGLNS